MMRAVLITSLGGLASAAAGQSLSVNLSFDSSFVAIGDTASATLSASFTGQPAGAYLSSINIDLIASNSSFSVSDVSSIEWNNAGFGFTGQGTASGSDILGIDAIQFSLIPPPVSAGSPILIMTFTVTRNTELGTRWVPRLTEGSPFMFSVTGGAFSDPPIAYGIEAFRGGFIPPIPSPGALGVLVLGLGVAGRRRRAG